MLVEDAVDAIAKAEEANKAYLIAVMAFTASNLGLVLSLLSNIVVDHFLVSGGILLSLICAFALTMMCFEDSEYESSLQFPFFGAVIALIWSLSWASLAIFSLGPMGMPALVLFVIFSACANGNLALKLDKYSVSFIKQAGDTLDEVEAEVTVKD